jgi:hypothetical protein
VCISGITSLFCGVVGGIKNRFASMPNHVVIAILSF